MVWAYHMQVVLWQSLFFYVLADNELLFTTGGTVWLSKNAHRDSSNVINYVNFIQREGDSPLTHLPGCLAFGNEHHLPLQPVANGNLPPDNP